MGENLNLCDKLYLDLEGFLYYSSKIKDFINSINININTINNELVNIKNELGKIKYGPTSSRPTSELKIGLIYFDTDLNKPIWWNGTEWIDSKGDNSDLPTSGTIDDIPDAAKVSIGYNYFDTQTNTLYASNGNTWEVINCCGDINEIVIWANLFDGMVTYLGYEYIGWSNLEDNSYNEIVDINIWRNL